jgi:hypothetical protein
MLYTYNNNAVLMGLQDSQKHRVGIIDAESWNVKSGCTYSNQWALTGSFQALELPI